MRNIRFLVFILTFALTSVSLRIPCVRSQQNTNLDLTKADDLKALGTGRIIEKDNSIIKNVKLIEVNKYCIVYEKNSSTHDMMMEVILRIEFADSKWGVLKIEFPDNKPEINHLIY